MSALEWMPLVRKIAGQLITRLPANVERDDLIQAGAIAAMGAGDRYDPNQGATFDTFATHSIRGAMLDELRGTDPLSRATRAFQSAARAAESRLQQRLLRQPTHAEVAAEVGASLDEYHREPPVSVISTDDVADDVEKATDGGDPLDHIQHTQRLAALAVQIERLPEREQYVLRMYYEHDLRFQDIATTLGVTESRVCRLHKSAIERLRLRLMAY